MIIPSQSFLPFQQKLLPSLIVGMSRSVSLFNRKFSSSSNPYLLYHIPHQFDLVTASKKFLKDHQGHWFAPTVKAPTKDLALSPNNPLQQKYLPISFVKAHISQASYEGQYRNDSEEIFYDHHGAKQTRTITDWLPTSGKLGPRTISYLPIYSGFKLHPDYVEEALDEQIIDTAMLIPFDKNKLPLEATVDPFEMKPAMTQSIANERIQDMEKQRAEKAIRKKHKCLKARIININITFTSIKIDSNLLPFYILYYSEFHTQMMLAVKTKNPVVGKYPLSPIKVGAATAIFTTALSALYMTSVPFGAAFVMVSTAISVLWAKHGPSISHNNQQSHLQTLKEENESIAATPGYRDRLEQTSMSVPTEPSDKELEEYRDYFEALDLPQKKESLDKKMIKNAFINKIQEVHSDHHGNDFATRRVILARDELYKRAAKNNGINNEPGKRSFSTSSRQTIEVKVKEPPRSVHDPRAKDLITAVLNKDYIKALKLVKEDEVHPDSHDKGENTLLAQAAKKGDVEAITFAIDMLGASPDTSCDCPAHRTPLHYATSNRHKDAAAILLKKGANPNLINSYGETPLDIAVAGNNPVMIDLLKTAGGIQHKTLGKVKGLKAILGYKSNERTLLSNNPSNVDSVIYLPASPKIK